MKFNYFIIQIEISSTQQLYSVIVLSNSIR